MANENNSVDAIVEEVLRELGDLSKADPVPDEHSPGSAEPSEPPPGGAPADGAGEMESLEEIYGAMAPEELEEHMAALQKVMAAKAGAPDAGAAGSPPAPSPMASAPAPMARAEAPIAKSEVLAVLKSKGHFHPEAGCEVCAVKERAAAEQAERSRIEKSVKDSEAQVLQIAGATAKLAKLILGGAKPLRKSVEGVSQLPTRGQAQVEPPAKAVDMTQAQINATLNEKIPTMQKSDQSKVIAYFEGRLKLDSIAHLLA
jgi:hypothetical protein